MAKDASPYLPQRINYKNLSAAVQSCRGCDLYKKATQAVFGEGSLHAKIIFVGEQPGNAEDLAGHPFVGPAGVLLGEFLDEVGINRKDVYITNAVKHFKWEQGGKRRIHKKPKSFEIKACKPWLKAEVQLIHAEIVVCMGASAAQSAFGKTIKIGELRSRFHKSELSDNTFVTVHPSSLLRIPDQKSRHEAKALFRADLKIIAERLKGLERKSA